MKNVQVRATDELDHGTFKKCRGEIVKTGIVFPVAVILMFFQVLVVYLIHK